MDIGIGMGVGTGRGSDMGIAGMLINGTGGGVGTGRVIGGGSVTIRGA